jgi:Predicted membrane protein
MYCRFDEKTVLYVLHYNGYILPSKREDEGVENPGQQNKVVKIPHTYVIIFFFILVAAAATWLLPGGTYEKIEHAATGRMVVDPASFQYIEAYKVDLMDILLAFPQGFKGAASIIAFLFVVAGSFRVLEDTGAFNAGVIRAIRFFENKASLLIPCTMMLFSIGGFMFGMSEETIIFVPLGIAVASRLGFDRLAGTAMVSLGALAGFTGGLFNPFSVGVAQGIAELPMFSGLWFRIIMYCVLLVTGIIYVQWYAMRVKKDPSRSIMAGVHSDIQDRVDEADSDLTMRRQLVLLLIVLGFGYIVYGAMYKDFYMDEIAAVFLGMGIVGGFIGGLLPSRMARSFVEGAKTIIFGALVVGLSRGIVVILTQGKIIDTVVHGLAAAVQGLPLELTAIGMMFTQSILNFIIPSASGMAATTMPILIPLGDVIGLSRQATIVAFQFGDGLTNMVTPTSAGLMGYLAVAGIPFDRWCRFALPILGVWMICGIVLTWVAAAIQLT